MSSLPDYICGLLSTDRISGIPTVLESEPETHHTIPTVQHIRDHHPVPPHTSLEFYCLTNTWKCTVEKSFMVFLHFAFSTFSTVERKPHCRLEFYCLVDTSGLNNCLIIVSIVSPIAYRVHNCIIHSMQGTTVFLQQNQTFASLSSPWPYGPTYFNICHYSFQFLFLTKNFQEWDDCDDDANPQAVLARLRSEKCQVPRNKSFGIAERGFKLKNIIEHFCRLPRSICNSVLFLSLTFSAFS